MPFTKITSGKNKGKYRKTGEKGGRIWTLGQIQAYHAKKGKRAN